MSQNSPTRRSTAWRDLLQVVDRDFRARYMARRPDWNRMGPALPAWFRLRLKRIDSRLVPQFVPPVTVDPAGVPAGDFPHGVWYICARVPRSRRWLAKRAAYVLVDEDGQPAMPTMSLLKMLKEARNLRRRNRSDDLERMYQESIAALTRDRAQASRVQLTERIVGIMKRMGMTSYGPRVFIPAMG